MSGPLHDLGINPTILLANGVLFLLLLAILNAVFWQPIMRHLDQRKRNIQHAYETVDATRKELDRLRSEYQTRLTRIEAEARTRIQGAVREAQAQREQLISAARAQSQEIIANGSSAIEAEKTQTLFAMRAGLDEVALNTLAKALGSAPTSAQRALINEYIAQHVLRS